VVGLSGRDEEIVLKFCQITTQIFEITSEDINRHYDPFLGISFDTTRTGLAIIEPLIEDQLLELYRDIRSIEPPNFEVAVFDNGEVELCREILTHTGSSHCHIMIPRKKK
jgi:hypothetical protein